MNKADIAIFNTIEKEYKNDALELRNAYNCEWDDSVHESFDGYVKDIYSIAEWVDTFSKRANRLKDDVDDINCETMIEIAKSLCKEAKAYET